MLFTALAHSRGRAVAAAALIAATGWILRAAWGLPVAIGAGRRALRPSVAGSPQFTGGAFRNTLTTTSVPGAEERRMLLHQLRYERRRGIPARPVPLVEPRHPETAGELAVTWFGHSSALLEIDGRRILVDPVWGRRVSPSPLVGPARLHPAPGPLADLPPVDAVLISHDHYDHLDLPTVRELLRRQAAPFVVPLGLGAHLRRWGAPEDRIVELDWNGSVEIAGLTLTCTEARHFSGRFLTRDTTLWSSWVVAGPRSRLFFGGDTGYTPAFAAIGARLGPFDVTLLPVGAYNEAWKHVHMNPEEAVRAHGDLGGGLLVPVHWATFNLGFHPWAEPIQRLRAAAERAGVRVAVPRPGERIEVENTGPTQDWWTAVGASETPAPGSGPASTGAGRPIPARRRQRRPAR